MTNKLKKVGKKAFSMSVVVMTIAWSIGVAALVPAGVSAAACPTLAAGDLFKVADNTAVYLLNADMERMYFPNAEVYKTWYADYSGINVIPNTCVDAYPAPTAAPYGVNYRPGSRLVKVQISPSVYVVEPGNTKARIGSEAVAAALYGANWATEVRDVSDVFWPNYANNGAELTESVIHNGMLVRKAGTTTVYEMVDGMLKMVDGTLGVATSGDVQEVSAAIFDAASLSSTTVTVPSLTEDPTQGASTGGVVVTGGDLTVSLSANTPVSSYIAKGAYNAEFAKFSFKAVSGDVVVSQVVLKRDGFGADADLTTVRLFDGATQVGSDQSINTVTHEITFKNLNWTIASGVTKTLTVKADTSINASGTNDYISLVSVTADGTVGGSALPISGNSMQYHSVTVGVIDVDALTSPAASNMISGATNQEVACFNFDTNPNEGFYVHSLTLTNNGTVANGEISNFVLRDGSTIVGSNSASFGSNGKVTIDMTASPYFIDKSKTKDLCLSVDIASGIKDALGKTIVVQIAESKDVVLVGDLSKTQVLPRIDNDLVFTAQTSATMTITQGTLTVANNIATNPVATALVDGVTHNKLAAYKFTAGSTEGARITRLRLTVSDTTVTSADLSNFELYTYDETTATETLVSGSASISGGYVTFEDNNGLFDIATSKNAVVHVYADVNTSASYTNAVLFIGSTNSDLIVKAKGLASGDFLTATDVSLSSVAAVNGIVFTNSTNGTLTVSLNQDSPAATSVAKGATDVDFAHAKFYASSENLSISSITVRAYAENDLTSFTIPTTTDYLNARLYDITDALNPVMVGSAIATPNSGVTTFSTNLTVAKDAYKVLKVVADVPTDSEAPYLRFVFASTTTDLTVSGVSSGATVSSTDITGSAVGKVMTVATPSVSVSWAVTPPAQSIVTSAQNAHVATLNLTAGAYEDVKVTSIKVRASTSTALTDTSTSTDAFTSLKLMSSNGTTQYGITKNLTDGGASAVDYVTFDGITNLTVPKGQTIQLYLYANVDGTSGSWYFGTTATTDVSGTGSVSGNSATITGTGVSTAQTITGSATVTFTQDASTGATQLVAVGASGTGTEVEMLTVDADVLYEDVDLTKLLVYYVGPTGDDASGAFLDNGVKLYKKTNGGAEVLVGSTSFVPTTSNATSTATFNIAAGNLRLGKDDTNTLVIKVLFNGVSTGAAAANSPLIQIGNGSVADTTIVEAKGVSSGSTLAVGAINGASTLNITGNDRVLYKSFPTITHVTPASTVLVNGVENDIFSFKVKADANGSVSIKQLALNVDIVDNRGTTNDGQATSFKLYRGTTDISGNLNIFSGSLNDGGSNAAAVGEELESGTNVVTTGTAKLVYVTWEGTNEETVPAGSEYTYTLKATLSGFGTDADDDYIRVRLANGQATSGELSIVNNPYYLMTSTSVDQILVLADSVGINTSTAVDSILWSDRSASGHSAASSTGVTPSSTGDWFNGYYVVNTPTNYSMLIR